MAVSRGDVGELMAEQPPVRRLQRFAPENRGHGTGENGEQRVVSDPELMAHPRGTPQDAEDPRPRLRVTDGVTRQHVHAAAEAWARADMGRPVELAGGPLSTTAFPTVEPELGFSHRKTEAHTGILQGDLPAAPTPGPVSGLVDADRPCRGRDTRRRAVGGPESGDPAAEDAAVLAAHRGGGRLRAPPAAEKTSSACPCRVVRASMRPRYRA